ncbi:MAG: hypothetical protein U0R68_15215 [Candidatus Nanopelagicales bacterium]
MRVARRTTALAAITAGLALVVVPPTSAAPVSPAAASDLTVHVTWPSPFDPVWLTTSQWQSVEVTNTGSSPATLPAPVLSDGGAHPTDWTLDDRCAGTLAAGATCMVYLDYRPKQAWTGTATLTLDGVGVSGSTVLSWPVVAKADDLPPTVSVPPIAPFAPPTFPYAQAAGYIDHQTLEKSEDIRVRLAGPTASSLGPWLYPRVWQDADYGGPTGYGLFVGSLVAGATECLSYRARDIWGNVSAWTAPRCTSAMWDDKRALTSVRGWTRGTGDVRYYEFGTWTRATARGATLAGPTVTSRRIAVLGTTCPTCGAVDVYVGTTRLGTLSMKGAMKHRALLMLPARATAVHGQIRLVVRTSGLPVIVDAIGTRIN